jgi:phytoene dehydrogenase-like protein
MAKKDNVVIVGAGLNGLVTAYYLARAGFKPIVLERRPIVGGVAVTEEFHPGFRASTIAHTAGPLLPVIAREMKLEQFGFQLIEPDVRIFAPAPDGRSIVLYNDPAKSAQSIAKFSTRDAGKFLEFESVLGRITQFLSQLITLTPPDIENPSSADLFRLFKVGRNFRGLGKKDMQRLLRWGPMAVADFAAEWFESELLRAMISSRAIFGTATGPWSPGTTAVLLLRAAAESHYAGVASIPRGGMGGLTQAMAAVAQKAGAQIRTRAEVAQITVKGGAVTGIVLADGEEIPARAVISNADPKRTFLKLLDPVTLEPSFLAKVQHYRSTGAVAKINLALSGPPQFKALQGASNGTLSGRIHIGPDIDYIERAFDASKYGEFSRRPSLEITIPSLADPSLAPAGQHVMSIFAHYAPYHLKAGDWDSHREALSDAVVETLEEYVPDLAALLLDGEVLTPKDLETNYGLTGGHIFHGEPALDQLFTMRPLLGWSRYRTPIRGLYLCGSGTHPGVSWTGASGYNAAREIRKDLKR